MGHNLGKHIFCPQLFRVWFKRNCKSTTRKTLANILLEKEKVREYLSFQLHGPECFLVKWRRSIDFKRLLQMEKLRWHPDTWVLLVTIQTSTGIRRTRTEGFHCCTNHQDQPLFPVVPNYSGATSFISRPGSYFYCRIRMWLAEIRVWKSSHINFVLMNVLVF